MTNQIYLKSTWSVDEQNQEILIGLLSQFPFESFEQHQKTLIGYIQKSEYQEDSIIGLNKQFNHIIDHYSVDEVVPQNWNEQWENSFQPIRVRHFCGIRASFHEPLTDVEFEIIIDPKMAFGTGHHETTWMMIDQMSRFNFDGINVLDYGAGTAILSILAEKLGAAKIDAVEIEEAAVVNALQNVQINQCRNIKIIEGDLHSVPGNQYDLILANINRNVILESLSRLRELIDPNGWILFSGILQSDETLLSAHLSTEGFQLLEVTNRGEWLCLKTKKA